MDFQKNLEIKKNIQNALIEYVDEGNEDSYDQLIKLISELKIEENPNELKDIIRLINTFYNNHHRTRDFFSRIDKLVLHYISNIQQLLSNKENFYICKFNFRFLLLLYQEKIISIEDYPKKSGLFRAFFYEKFHPDFSKVYEITGENLDLEKYDETRKIGENHLYICSLIRNDSIKEFISYVNKSNYPLSSRIKRSPFETNELLQGRGEVTLIQYAAFFGSIQVFQYLKMNEVELTPSLWLYAIHSNSPEMIHILEENNVPITELFEYVSHPIFARVDKKNASKGKILNALKELMNEAIKCHHNDIFNYLQNNFDLEKNTKEPIDDDEKEGKSFWNKMAGLFRKDDNKQKNNSNDNNMVNLSDEQLLYPSIFGSYNYSCFPEKIEDNLLFYYLVTYGYTSLVEYFLKEKDININALIIFTNF